MQKEFRSIDTLRNWDKNPRAIKKDKFEELKRRITKRGQFKPLIITPDGEVLGGNMRLRAMKELGVKDVWVSVVEPKDEADKIEIALTDNEEMGYYEEQALAELIAEFQQDIDLTKYSVHLEPAKTLKEILNEVSPEEVIEDEAPEVQEESVSEIGKIYQVGKHRVMCGDSTKIEDVERLMAGKKADMVFTSPPYNADTNAGDGDIFTSKKNKKLYDNGYSDDLESNEYVTLCKKVLRNCFEFTNGFIFWNVNYNANSKFEYIEQIVDCLPFLIEQICWKKSSTIPFKGCMKRAWEPIYVFSTNKKSLGLNEVIENHWQISNTDSQQDNHKACFPVGLPYRTLQIMPDCSNIFDPFLGSGSTLIACEQTNRICYGMELDPKYVDVIRKRYAKFVDPENWEERWQEMTPETAN